MINGTLFAQIIQTLDRFSFKKRVAAHQTDKHQKGITSWTHLVTMLFCRFSKLNSLRDVCNGLKSTSGNLNHLGVERASCKSSLSYQNKNRDCHADFEIPESLRKLSVVSVEYGGIFAIKPVCQI